MHISPPCAYVKDTETSKGLGVFSSRSVKANETVEVCPVVVLRGLFSALPEQLKTRVFNWAVLAGEPNSHGLALGYGSMYNHANPANMRYEADAKNTQLRFVAVRDIADGEELTVNYNAVGGGAEWHDDNWFNRMNIQPLQNKA